MALREWFRPPRHVLVIFLVVAGASAGVLGWLATRLLDQEQTVETERRQERVEQAADRAAALMQGALSGLDLQLASGAAAGAPPSQIVIVHVAGGRIEVQPEGGLIYYPDDFPRTEAPDAPFVEAERAEFVRRDLDAAAKLYSKLTGEANASVATAAWTRLARVYRKMQNDAAALDAADRARRSSDVYVGGLPAGLIAREGRASIFEQSHRENDLRSEALAIRDDMRTGRWRLTKSQYQFYSAEAARWLGTSADDPGDSVDSVSRAEAFDWLWRNRTTTQQTGRRLIVNSAGAGAALAVWNRSSDEGFGAAIGGPEYLESLCRNSLSDRDLGCTLTDTEGRPVVGQDPPARVAAVRAAAASKLPWTMEVYPASVGASPAASAERRLLLWVLAVLAAVWAGGAYFIMSAIAREMRVARLQSDFVAAVSHEFRSPLSSLRQISEMLVDDRWPSDAARRESHGVLARESERLHHLVEDLLDFGRFDSGRAVFHFEPIELRGFLQVLVGDFQQRVAARGYRVELNLPGSDVVARADGAALSRAIWNLLDNAVQYSPNSQTVWVDVEASQQRVSIVVRDRGIGIPAGEQREIFERFVRGSQAKTLRIKGTGIGLAMVRHIMQAHGGEILLASEPGQGSRFTMVLDVIGGAS